MSSIRQIAEFLLYLFQEKKLQPGTIDSYRTTVVNKVGNLSIEISKDENLAHLLNTFHRVRTKGCRGIASWNLSLALHHLTKAPFELLREASLKHLTFKTVFLLALASGKCRSEIHSWMNRNMHHKEDWSKVSLYPSPTGWGGSRQEKPLWSPRHCPLFWISSFKEDRSLCPARAHRHYLDRSEDLRDNKELVCVSFKKTFAREIFALYHFFLDQANS